MFIRNVFWGLSILVLISQTACSIHTNITDLNKKIESSSGTVPSTPVPETPTAPLACDPSITNSYGGGDGQSTTPFTICTLNHWNYFSADTGNYNKHFKMHDHLDFTGVAFADFKMIGSPANPFTGTFDGGNYEIKNVNVNSGASGAALFINTDGSATIKNLKIKNFQVSATVRAGVLILSHGSTIGTLTVNNISLDTVHLSISSAAFNVGTLVGTSGTNVIVSDIEVNTVLLNASDANTWGGLVGSSSGNISFANVTGDSLAVSSTGNGNYVGGVLGIGYKAASFTDISVTGLYVKCSTFLGGVAAQVREIPNFTRVRIFGNVVGLQYGAGLIMESVGIGATSANIVESSFTGDISGTFVSGGLIGVSYAKDVLIQRSFFKGNMFSVWNGQGGGLISNLQGATASLTIEDSYVVGNIANSHATSIHISGFVAQAQNSITIVRSYFSGGLGGVAPRSCVSKTTGVTSVVTTDVYYDSTLCTANAGSAGPITGSTGLATAALQTSTPFTNWSPTVWVFTSGQNPKLAWE